MAHPKEERTLIILKPDCVQRGILGQVIERFERKGLKITGLKMMQLSDAELSGHYAPHKDKPFFESLKKYMKSAPVVLMVITGIKAVEAVRLIVGPTKGYAADAGCIRGDFSMSGNVTIVHASDSVEAGKSETERLFKEGEIFDYNRADFLHVYGEDELS
ncbi:MAG: nucleoside-diphosphate kinase [Candidatus Vogelbacteria bacterium]|nr:nucleoside-diphosphate kinase [Candidatus Vogelbacteria bacterium]